MESRFLAIHPSLETRFQAENPYDGDKNLSNCRQYVALCYMENNQLFKKAVEQKQILFSEDKVTVKGLHTAIVKERRKKHAEKMLFREFRKTNKYNEFDPSRMPNSTEMILYSTLSPCEKCMDIIKEFAENCEIGTTITIVYKEVYDILIEKTPRKNTIRLFNLEELKSQHTKPIDGAQTPSQAPDSYSSISSPDGCSSTAAPPPALGAVTKITDKAQVTTQEMNID